MHPMENIKYLGLEKWILNSVRIEVLAILVDSSDFDVSEQLSVCSLGYVIFIDTIQSRLYAITVRLFVCLKCLKFKSVRENKIIYLWKIV